MQAPSNAEWRSAVYRYRGPHLGNGARVLLLYLADNMRADRKVSVPRSKIAEALGVAESEVTKRVKAAHEAGLLTTVAPGKPRQTAVYQGVFPDVARGNPVVTSEVRFPVPLRGNDVVTPETPSRGHPGVAATTKPQPELSVEAHSGRNERKTSLQNPPTSATTDGRDVAALARRIANGMDLNREIA